MTTCKQTRLTKTWPLIAVLLLTLHRAAVAAPPLYDVEIIVFRHNVMSDAGEKWTRPDAGELQPTQVFSQDEFTELSPPLQQLDTIHGGLRNSRNYRVLLHRAWRQVGYDAAHAIAYPIHALAGKGSDLIEGSVTLERERYLHLDVDLTLVPGGGTSPVRSSDGPDGGQSFRLHENRRMRSREVHYFDHPRFGVIATVTPYDAPEEEPEPETGDMAVELDTADAPVSGTGPDDDQLTR